MGLLRSEKNHAGLIVRGVALGFAAREVDYDGEPFGEYRWEHPALPSGFIEDDGTITIDDMEGI